MRVSLVSMPFGLVFSPSIALGLLKPIAQANGCEVDVRYFNLDFAARIGTAFYHDIASGALEPQNLVGEWIFAGCLPRGTQPGEDEEFLREIVGPAIAGVPRDGTRGPIPVEPFIARLRAARAAAAAFIEECASRVLDYEPALVGLTSVFEQHAASLALAARIKAREPHVFTVMGGANCEGEMGRVLLERMPWIDAVVSGEGEEAFEQLLRARKAGRVPAPFPNLLVRSKEVRIAMPGEQARQHMLEDLDRLPIPDYSDFFRQRESAGVAPGPLGLQIPFETSRGCWWGAKHHCTFCGLNADTMKFRSKHPDRALEELKVLTAAYPSASIGVTDNILDMKYFQTFLPRLADEGLGLRMFYEVKANLSIDQLRVLKRAGVTRIQPGIESLSTAVLELMRKGVRAIQNVQLLRDCAATGVLPVWNLLWGFPGESAAEYRSMAALLPSLFHLSPPGGAACLRLDRFSPLYEKRGEHGVGGVRTAPAYRYVYGLPEEDLLRLAYYFDFESANTPHIEQYTADLLRAVRLWKSEHQDAELVYSDDGRLLRIWDTRSCAACPLTILTGVDREAYLFFAKHHKAAAALESIALASPGYLDDLVGTLRERRLVAVLDSAILSLAVPLEAYKPKPRGRAALARAMSEVSVPSPSGGRTIPIETYLARVAQPA
jgi:ribosomal peptide maturation radical SAM protein 1